MSQSERELETMGRAQLRQALHDYAKTHPNASDTLNGVRGFWLPAKQPVSELDLEAVLRELVATGVLATTALPDGSALYSVVRGQD